MRGAASRDRGRELCCPEQVQGEGLVPVPEFGAEPRHHDVCRTAGQVPQ